MQSNISAITNPAGHNYAAGSATLSPSPPQSENPIFAPKQGSTPGNNWRTFQYYNIINLLNELSRLDPEDDFHVGRNVRTRASDIISYIKELYDIDFPKLLPEGEDSLSLTWDLGGMKQFLTIYPDEVESTVYSRVYNIRCVHSLSLGERLDYAAIFAALPGKQKSTTG